MEFQQSNIAKKNPQKQKLVQRCVYNSAAMVVITVCSNSGLQPKVRYKIYGCVTWQH